MTAWNMCASELRHLTIDRLVVAMEKRTSQPKSGQTDRQTDRQTDSLMPRYSFKHSWMWRMTGQRLLWWRRRVSEGAVQRAQGHQICLPRCHWTGAVSYRMHVCIYASCVCVCVCVCSHTNEWSEFLQRMCEVRLHKREDYLSCRNLLYAYLCAYVCICIFKYVHVWDANVWHAPHTLPLIIT